MAAYDFYICILFICRKIQKLPKNDHFWVWRAIAGQGGSGSKNHIWQGPMSDRCLIEWHRNQLNRFSQKGCRSVNVNRGRQSVIFRTGLKRGQSASIPTNLVPKIRASDALQTFLWTLSTKSTEKKVILEKVLFSRPQKTRISRIKRARQTCATNEQFSQILHRSMHNRTKFQTDRSGRTAQNVFWRRESASFF